MHVLRGVGLAGVLAFMATGTALADDWTPSTRCMKPVKPYEFTSQYQVNSFKNEVEAYESCIDRFIKQQREQAKNHLEAAKKAVDEWNHFVNFELR